jgi:putative transposase
VLEVWLRERAEFLKRHGIDIHHPDWREGFEKLPQVVQSSFHEFISDRWQAQLDQCYGQCVLARQELADIVANSLLYFDNDRYLLTDYVVMPNHVHIIAAFPSEDAMLEQCESWKHFTATKINRILGRKGRFWQQDGFDHLVRSLEQFDYLRRYIADNPKRAGISVCLRAHYSRPL